LPVGTLPSRSGVREDAVVLRAGFTFVTTTVVPEFEPA
jgi:hypothetical protein